MFLHNHYPGLLFVCLLVLSTMMSTTVQARSAPVVSTVRVTEQPITAGIELIGTLKASQQVAIAPQVSARVTRVHFVPGQVIIKDQVLLSLDDRAAQATVREAEALLMDARRVFNNFQTLFRRKAVTQTELDGQQAAVAMAEAKLQAARVQADYLTLKAPFAGVIGLSDVAPGMLLAANTPVADLLDASSLKLDLAVPDKYFRHLKVGDQLSARTLAYGEQIFIGELAVIAPSVDEDTLNARVRLLFDNSEGLLVPGMLMRVQLTVDNSTQAVIPTQSLLYAGQQRYVFVVDDEGKVSRRDVSIGRNLGDQVTIADGLTLGEQVISEGTVKVRDGMLVEVQSEAL
ncbi:efflux RND transporter periplasmic adaptor subunit [Oceanisphaera arctica]|uniref:Efflux transporter periplasmic adaptor subunit n=1 Tax=Oceanisphaera arctica TaxID=641510 RepID=A0A2P5TL08_9GAMM|nr:efflux RND transporter periplasmic adaptor subunit [Oceanisphaera arctica]PPL15885.1 efflux transporter periplasmic adaptor subunit [Oceanisphaera arctica]GHA26964.1 MexH family multidrug efflux RND transporter periplasmic adaptor subunit [Oceanisphaera arctica]